MNKLVYVGLSILALSLHLNVKADSSGTGETVLASDLTLESYISGVAFQNDETVNATLLTQDQVKHGYEVVKRGDGSCYKQTTQLHGFKKVKTQVPGIFIELPKITTENTDVDCNVKTLAHVQ